MNKIAAIIESAEKVRAIIGAKAICAAYDMTYDNYAYIYFDNGKSIGSHIKGPKSDFIEIALPSWFEGKRIEDYVWRIAPAKLGYVLLFLAEKMKQKTDHMEEKRDDSKYWGGTAFQDDYKEYMGYLALWGDYSEK